MVENMGGRKRGRGRPQVRTESETRALIIEAASDHFQELGFAAANINVIASNAGVSTKTLYRLFPTKADVFSSLIQDRIDRFFLSLDEGANAAENPREGLIELLVAYSTLTLGPHTLGINRLVIAEADRFPEIARTFFEQAIMTTSGIFQRWIERQIEAGRLAPYDPFEMAGMLRGMMIMEPQRAAFLRQRAIPEEDAIRARAAVCADIFLNGTMVRSV